MSLGSIIVHVALAVVAIEAKLFFKGKCVHSYLDDFCPTHFVMLLDVTIAINVPHRAKKLI